MNFLPSVTITLKVTSSLSLRVSTPMIDLRHQDNDGTTRIGVLLLEDGSIYIGKAFGFPRKVFGEVVFNTGMVGYPEALTDPSYYGQILVLTYPLIGNYGVPSYSIKDPFGLPLYFESTSIKIQGLIIHELCRLPHHWSSTRSLDDWLYEERIPGIEGIDTRKLVRKLREHGVMNGIMAFFEPDEEIPIENLLRELKRADNPNKENLVRHVSPSNPIVHAPQVSKYRIVVIDCGVKLNIIRSLLRRKTEVIRVPYNTSADEILEYNPDGVLISNGPGDPKKVPETIATVREIIEEEVPFFGICLGNQVFALAMGADTYKLKYGHRSQNQPCIELQSGKCFITSQNHGYAVSITSLKDTDLELWFLNINDKTTEGIKHRKLPAFSVQFHPEASPGPIDTGFLFDRFLEMVAKHA